jgi:predicted metal-binding membrane protein
MWTVMMMAMMLPSLMPALWRYHQTMGAPSRVALGDPRLLTMLAGAGYFFVWMVLGMAVFPLGAVLTELEMQQPGLARAVPLMGGIVVLAAGAIQLTGWKARRLACCRDTSCHGSSLRAVPDSAWRHGLRLGLRCTWCCGNLMIIPLVIGVMDLSAMAAVAIAVTVERLAPASERFARAIGVVTCATGVVLIARAAW